MTEDLRSFLKLLQGSRQVPYPYDPTQSIQFSVNFVDFFERGGFVELNESELFFQQQDVSFYTPVYQFNIDSSSFFSAGLFAGSTFGVGNSFEPFKPFKEPASLADISDDPSFSEALLPRPDPDFEFGVPQPEPTIPLNLTGEITSTTLDTENVFPFSLVSIGGNPLPDEVEVVVTLDIVIPKITHKKQRVDPGLFLLA